MRAYTLLSAFLAVAVTSVWASVDASPAALIARQDTATPNIPPECQASCAAIEKITTCGADLSCMCTKAMGQGMVDCGTCGIKFYASDPNINTYKAQFQASINSFAGSCKNAGYDIGTFDVLGGGSSPSPSSSAGAGSGTGSGAAPSATKSSNGAASFRAGGLFVGLATAAMSFVL